MRIVKNAIQQKTKAKRLTIKWYTTLVNTYDVVCLSFYTLWERGEESGNFGAEYDKAARIIANLYPRERHKKGMAIMVKVNCYEEKELEAMFNIDYYPTYKIIKSGQEIECGKPKTYSAEHFLQFIEQHISDRVMRYPMSDTSRIYFPQYMERVPLDEFTSFVKEYDFILIFFYVAASPACKISWHVFHEAYRELTRIYVTTYENPGRKTPEVVFAAMECGIDKNVAKHFNIRKYPFFKLVQSGKIVEEYQCDGTMEGFVNFVELHRGLSKSQKRHQE